IEGHAITLRDELGLLRKEIEATKPDRQTKARMKKIEDQVKKILERPITPPLSDKEGIEAVHVNALLRERINQLKENEPYRQVAYRFDLQLSDSAVVRASSQWLRQVIDILVDNAVEAMIDREDKQLTISTRQLITGVEIALTDTGRGIPDGVVRQLFQKRTASTKGLGMGLLMASTIVQAYGGNIYLDSVGPNDTTFVVWLPLDYSNSNEHGV
ncbi:MAG: HAMP domain-containing sensor histidine kinase, partial [Candidatus Promineifilaceae bacterium]